MHDKYDDALAWVMNKPDLRSLVNVCDRETYTDLLPMLDDRFTDKGTEIDEVLAGYVYDCVIGFRPRLVS